MIDVRDSTWAKWAAGASAAAALATFVLAGFTFWLARETNASLKVARDSLQAASDAATAEQERHMDTFQPHLAFEVVDEQRPIIGQQYQKSPHRSVYVRNIGPGYARDIKWTSNRDLLVEQKRAGYKIITEAASLPIALASGADKVLAMNQDYLNEKTKLPLFKATYKDAFGRSFSSTMNGFGTNNPYAELGTAYDWDPPSERHDDRRVLPE